MKQYQIPLSKPDLTSSDLDEITACFKSSWISSKSVWVDKFEKAFAKSISHTKYAVAVNSGTSALFLALKSLGIGPGDEVIIPAYTMIATINAITWIGATPILVDCTSKENWNINPEQIINKVTKKTKAIIPVHIYGFPCNMDAILNIAKKHKLYVVEDAAEAMGSIYNNQYVGSFGDLSCFSLYSNKIITTGNGGIITTNNNKLYLLLRKLRFFDYGIESHFTHRIIGYNLVLSGLQASLGYSQTKRFSELINKRRLINNWYHKYLKYSHIRFLQPLPKTNPSYWFPAIILKSSLHIKKVQLSLEKNKIETRVFFRPIHKQPVYQKMFMGQMFPYAEYFWKHGLLLPSFYSLKEEDVKHIAAIINASLK